MSDATSHRAADLERWHDWFDAELERSGDWQRACEVADLPQTVMRKFEENQKYAPFARRGRVNRQVLAYDRASDA